MYYGKLKNCDIANGKGVRVTLFVSGCRNQCPKCFQPETWDFTYGTLFTEETEHQVFAWLQPDYINGLTVLGGEPFEPENQRGLLPFLKQVREKFPRKDIWCFTGFTLEELQRADCRVRCEVTDELLQQIDVLVDGRYVDELHDISLKFRGSTNQRLIDLAGTRQSGAITLLSDD